MANASNTPTSGGSTDRSALTNPLTPSQIITLVVGVVFTLGGIIGFAVTGTSDFAAANTGNTLLGFEINGLHNVVNLVIGIAGLALWRTDAMSRMYGWGLAAASAVLFIYGLFVVNSSNAANFLSLNVAGNVLHLVMVGVGVAVAMLPAAIHLHHSNTTMHPSH